MKNKIINYKNSFENNSIINSLNNTIYQQQQQINQLRIKLQNDNSSQNINIFNRSQMRCVHFISTDSKVHFSVPCLGDDLFVEIEKKLYEQFPEYTETNNYFLSQGKQILRFKTISQNNIGNGLPVTLIIPNIES